VSPWLAAAIRLFKAALPLYGNLLQKSAKKAEMQMIPVADLI